MRKIHSFSKECVNGVTGNNHENAVIGTIIFLTVFRIFRLLFLVYQSELSQVTVSSTAVGIYLELSNRSHINIGSKGLQCWFN